MKLDVTRDVISDLWPLRQSGEASGDSRKLIDDYLDRDEAFATILEKSATLRSAMPALSLSPDAERRLLDDARDRARAKLMVIGGAIALAGVIALIALGGVLLLVSGGW